MARQSVFKNGGAQEGSPCPESVRRPPMGKPHGRSDPGESSALPWPSVATSFPQPAPRISLRRGRATEEHRRSWIKNLEAGMNNHMNCRLITTLLPFGASPPAVRKAK